MHRERSLIFDLALKYNSTCIIHSGETNAHVYVHVHVHVPAKGVWSNCWGGRRVGRRDVGGTRRALTAEASQPRHTAPHDSAWTRRDHLRERERNKWGRTFTAERPINKGPSKKEETLYVRPLYNCQGTLLEVPKTIISAGLDNCCANYIYTVVVVLYAHVHVYM